MLWSVKLAFCRPAGERDFSTSLLTLDQHSNQTVRFEGQAYSLCQV